MNSRERLIFSFAILGLAMSLVMTALSAYIRLAESGIGCEPWPECQAQHFNIDDQPGIAIAATDDNRGLRMLHRFMASSFGFVAMLLVILNLWYRRQLNFKPSLSIICFALTMLLAMVGMVTPDVIHPVVTFINLTAGMLTTAVLWLLVLKINNLRVGHSNIGVVVSTQISTASRWLSSINVWLVIVVIASGAWVSANFASGACTSFPGCEFTSSSMLIDAFDLSRELEIADGSLVLGDAQSVISGFHHLLPVSLFILLVVGGYLNFQIAPISSVLTTILAAGLIFLGLVDSGIVGKDQPRLLSAWLHNFYSMLLLLAVIYNRQAIK